MKRKTPSTADAVAGTDPEIEYLNQLIGWRVDRIVRIVIDSGGYQEDPRYALVLTRQRNKKEQLFVEILSDPEGNGPGFLDIEKEKYGT